MDKRLLMFHAARDAHRCVQTKSRYVRPTKLRFSPPRSSHSKVKATGNFILYEPRRQGKSVTNKGTPELRAMMLGHLLCDVIPRERD